VSATLLPAFLKLEGRRVVIVGGGPMAASKLAELLKAGARVKVVAPEVRDEIVEAGVRVARRPFRPADLDGAWYVVAAATPAVNRAVARAARLRRVFVNAVDDKTNATAYLGGVVRRGGVTLAVSTEGAAPALAGLLREGLEAVLPNDLGAWRTLAARLRAGWKGAAIPLAWRRPLLLDALNRLYATKEHEALKAAS
jgi:uroporphyrin-III C-methyltransferase / precorrin-2 dehydrogenase / sirohydrochlorin ferrochelatase